MFCSKCGQVLHPDTRFCESCGASTTPKSQQRPGADTADFSHSGSSYRGKYRSGVSVIILSIITCGIYGWYWLYVTMEDLNQALGERRINSGGLLLGSILCFPIVLVALYQIDKNMLTLAREEGTYYNENFILWIVLSLLTGVGTFVAYYQVTEALNLVWDKRRGGTPRNY